MLFRVGFPTSAPVRNLPQPARPVPPPPPPPPPKHEFKTIRVKPGDTFSGIAQEHRVPLKRLYRANPQFNPKRQDGIPHFDRSPRGGWDPDYLRPGDKIRVPIEKPHAHTGHPGVGHHRPNPSQQTPPQTSPHPGA